MATNAVTRHQTRGIEAWRERIGHVFMRFEMEAPRHRVFPSALGQRGLGMLQIYDFSAPAHAVRHRPSIGPDTDTRRVLAVLQSQGECRYADATQRLTLAPGDVLFLRAGQPFEMRFPAQMHLRVVSLPASALSRSVLGVRGLPALHARADDGATALTRAFVNSAYANAKRLDASAQARTSHALLQMLDLLAGTALEQAPVHFRSRRETLLARLQSHLLEHLDEPDLRADDVAHTLGLSPRYVRDLLQREGTSFGRLRLELRLARCHDDLLDAGRRHLSVSDIAYAWGFNSIAHFTRAFRARYGQPPARFRRAHTTCP